MAGPELPGRFNWLAPITVGLLIVLTIGAFGLSQRLKREPLVIDRVVYRTADAGSNNPKGTVFSPNGDCRRDLVIIRFRTTKSDRADVKIIGPGGNPVRVLAEDDFLKRYREHEFVWDGRKANGRVPGTSNFRVQVTLRGLDRVLVLPGRIGLRNYPPGESYCGPSGDGSRPAGAERMGTDE